MARLIVRRLLQLIPVLLLVSLATSMLLELVPGDPAVSVLGPDASAEDYARVNKELGMDKPVLTRYVSWLGNAVQGDLGHSIARPASTVTSLIGSRLPVTAEIAVLALLISLLVSVPLGMMAASRAGSALDRATAAATSAMISIPPFVGGLLLIYLFVFNQNAPRWVFLVFCLFAAGWILTHTVRISRAERLLGSELAWQLGAAVVIGGLGVLLFYWWPSFPRQGFERLTSKAGIRENLRTTFLPVLTLAIGEIAVFTRLLRSDMIGTLQEDFILSSRAKGMPARRVLVRDALRPSSFSLITLAGVSLGRLLGGTVIVETIFNLPGMGRLMVQDGVMVKDYPVVQGAVLVVAVLYVLLNLAVDLSYMFLDPRIRRG